MTNLNFRWSGGSDIQYDEYICRDVTQWNYYPCRTGSASYKFYNILNSS